MKAKGGIARWIMRVMVKGIALEQIGFPINTLGVFKN